MKQLQTTLRKAFSTNFMLYFQSHASHVNVTGRNFVSDHSILDSIYTDAQSNIDTYAEFMRTLGMMMPTMLSDVITQSELPDRFLTSGNVLAKVEECIDCQIEILVELYELAEEAKEFGLSGYVQERLVTHKKQCWMLESITGEKK
jgi:DNA-binding ferritin-like protein